MKYMESFNCCRTVFVDSRSREPSFSLHLCCPLSPNDRPSPQNTSLFRGCHHLCPQYTQSICNCSSWRHPRRFLNLTVRVVSAGVTVRRTDLGHTVSALRTITSSESLTNSLVFSSLSPSTPFLFSSLLFLLYLHCLHYLCCLCRLLC